MSSERPESLPHLLPCALHQRLFSAQDKPAAPPAPPAEQGAPAQAVSNPLNGLQFGLALEDFYQYNWNTPFDRVNLLRAYDTRANTFGIQQAALVFDFAPDVAAGRRFGGRVDLQFGQATETVILPFVGIKAIDLLLVAVGLA